MTGLQTVNLISSLTLFAFFILLIYLSFYWSFFWLNYKLKFKPKVLFSQQPFPFFKKIRRLKKNNPTFILIPFLLSIYLYYLLYFNLLNLFSFIFKVYPQYISLSFTLPLIILSIFSQFTILIIYYIIHQLNLVFTLFINLLSYSLANLLSFVKYYLQLIKIIIIAIFLSR